MQSAVSNMLQANKQSAQTLVQPRPSLTYRPGSVKNFSLLRHTNRPTDKIISTPEKRFTAIDQLERLLLVITTVTSTNFMDSSDIRTAIFPVNSL